MNELWNSYSRGWTEAPDAVALSPADGPSLTYDQLGTEAETLSDGILRRAPDAGDYGVGLLLPDGERLSYIAYLAAARTFHYVAPMHAQSPRDRSVRALVSSGIPWILGAGQDLEGSHTKLASFDVVGGAVDLWLSRQVVDCAGEAPADICYVMHTSGSTGTPKGVPISNEALKSYMDAVQPFCPMDKNVRHSQTFGFGFDLSVHDLFYTWGNAGAVCPPSPQQRLDVYRYVSQARLTHWFGVPTAFLLGLPDLGWHESADLSIRQFTFCGELLTGEVLEGVREVSENARIVNLYGPTEATIACAGFHVGDLVISPSEGVPIGYPFENVSMKLSPLTGELMIAGAQVFSGYTNVEGRDMFDAAGYYKTGDQCRQASADAPLEYIGRLDDQVKINGYRIELGEVERAAQTLIKGVATAVYLASPAHHLGLVYCDDGSREPGDLARALSEILPPYMVPARVKRVEGIPLNSNGKRDRAASARMLGAF